MEVIRDKTFGEERALYRAQDVRLENCAFDGPADGESALKEARNIAVENCFFNLRYPLWHDRQLTVRNSRMTELCRAALWYTEDVVLENTQLHGIKALRECNHVRMAHCSIVSPEFGWLTERLEMEDCRAESEYFLLRAGNLRLREVHMRGKYSFQYIHDAVLEDCTLDTKDAFWHAENVIVRNSLIKGEYLGWYSRNLTLENCLITGTQPLCWCTGLRLISCRMEHTDLCFEKSEVEATLTAPIESIKNPYAGHITAPAVKEIILDEPEAKAEVILTGQN